VPPHVPHLRLELRGLVDLYDAERLDRLRPAVLGELEILLREVEDGIPFVVGDDDVHANEVDPGPDGLLRRVSFGRRRRRRLLCLLRRLLRGRRHPGGRHRDDDEHGTQKRSHICLWTARRAPQSQ
jgi:hypothetical protein